MSEYITTMDTVGVLCTVILISGVRSYSTGPPESACQDATPQHRPYLPSNQTEHCPYLVEFTAFTPGVPHYLNITSWSGVDTFKGYQLTVFDENSIAVGTFSESERTICEGAAATHKEGGSKLSAPVIWIPPANSSRQLYYIWLTVVSNYSTFWVNCDRVILPAADAPEIAMTSTTLSTLSQTRGSGGSSTSGQAVSSTTLRTTRLQNFYTATAVYESKTKPATPTKAAKQHTEKTRHRMLREKFASSSLMLSADIAMRVICLLTILLSRFYVN